MDQSGANNPKPIWIKTIAAWARLNILSLVSCLLIILGFVITARLIWPYLDPVAEWTPYLLSAISQSMAAILALVFTISLIVGQLYSRYFYRMLPRLFDWFTIGYMSLFIAAVFLPIWFLAHESLAGMKASVLLAALSLLLLIPYFLRFRNNLDPEQMLMTVSRTISKKIQKGDKRLRDELAIIHNAAMVTLDERNYDTFNEGIGHMIDVCHQAYNEAQPTLGREVIERLHDIGTVALENPQVPETVMSAFNELVEWGISAGNTAIMQDVSLALYSYLRTLIKNQVEDMAEYGVGILKTIADAVLSAKIVMDQGDTWLAHNVSRGVGDLVQRAIGKGLWAASIEGVDVLANLGNDAIRNGLQQTANSCEHELRSVLFLIGKDEAAHGTERSIHKAEASILGSDITVPYWELALKDRQELGWKIANGLAILGNAAARECQGKGKIQYLDGIVSLVTQSLGVIAVTSVENSLRHAAYVWSASISDLAYAASGPNLESLWPIGNCLDRIGNALKKNKIEDVVLKTLSGLMGIGASSVAYGNNAMKEHVIGIIHGLGELSDSTVLSAALSEARGHLAYDPKLITALDEFWKSLSAGDLDDMR